MDPRNTKYEFITIPLDIQLQINSSNDIETIINKTYEYIDSDDFKKKFLVKNKKQYTYTYTPRIGQVDLPNDAD